MDKKKAFETVFFELIKIPMFTGIYDAKNGSGSFMNGISTVMERIAYELDLDDAFSDFFIENMERSRELAELAEQLKED